MDASQTNQLMESGKCNWNKQSHHTVTPQAAITTGYHIYSLERMSVCVFVFWFTMPKVRNGSGASRAHRKTTLTTCWTDRVVGKTLQRPVAAFDRSTCTRRWSFHSLFEWEHRSVRFTNVCGCALEWKKILCFGSGFLAARCNGGNTHTGTTANRHLLGERCLGWLGHLGIRGFWWVLSAVSSAGPIFAPRTVCATWYN